VIRSDESVEEYRLAMLGSNNEGRAAFLTRCFAGSVPCVHWERDESEVKHNRAVFESVV
jgi:hypothetical protein